MRVGVLPAVGNGLVHFERTGQRDRLFDHLRAYGGQCTYFSYMDDAQERLLWPKSLGRLVAPMVAPRDPIRYGVVYPLLRPGEFRACDVFRCTSLLGAIPAITAKLAYRKPFIFSHGADYVRIAQIHGRSRLHVAKWRALRAAAMRAASGVIVQNAEMAWTLKQAYPHAQIVALPNWVDTDVFHPQTPDIKTDDGRTVLYVGRLVEEKNLVTLANACRNVGARLVCAGEGPLREALVDRRAECVGAVPWAMLPNYHRIATVFAMVSHTEGHCKALTEAMASGLPCLVSKAVTEGMVPGSNCLRVDQDEASISLGLEVLLKDHELAGKLGRNASRTARHLWGKAKILEAEVNLLKEATWAAT